jgi:hypothetical protein
MKAFYLSIFGLFLFVEFDSVRAHSLDVPDIKRFLLLEFEQLTHCPRHLTFSLS